MTLQLINGFVKNIQDKQHLTYQIALGAERFETGKWIALDTVIGKISGRILVNGKGIHPNTMAATASLQLSSAVINKYSFQNINL